MARTVDPVSASFMVAASGDAAPLLAIIPIIAIHSTREERYKGGGGAAASFA